MNINNTQDLKRAIRMGPYAWPGGYPMFFITDDGAAISFEGARKEYRNILWSIKHECSDGFRVVAVDINYEDPDLFCDVTGERIESAYAED